MPEPQLAAITRRLGWGRDGSCWSFTNVPAIPYNPAAPDQQQAALERIQAVAASLPGEYAAWGLCQPWDDVALFDHMAAAHRGAAWAAQCAATMAALPGWETRFRRVYFLAVRLDGVRHRARLTVDARAAVPPERTVAAALEKAAILDRRLAQLGGRPAAAAEIGWIVDRVVTRGSADRPVDAAPDVLSGDRLAGLADCEIVNGGLDGHTAALFGRWARVDCHHGRGYQATIAIEQAPHDFEAPGGPGEWLARVERLNLPVDWFLAGTTEANAKAQKQVRFKKRQITGEGQDTGHDAAGVRPALLDALDALDAQEAELASTGQQALIWTSLFTIGATTIDELEQRVATIEDLFAGDAEYQLTRRMGRQKALLLAQLPCHRFGRKSPLWRFRHYTMPTGFAGAAPFCGSAGGDPTGLLLAVDAGTGVRTPLFFDPGYAASIDQSPSFILCGELGSGKSLTAKRIACEGYIPAGGQVLALDFTQSKDVGGDVKVGEWVHLASVLDCPTAVIDLSRGGWSIDPCAMDLPSDVKRRMLEPALLVACNYNDDTTEANRVSTAVGHVVAGACGGRAGGVVRWLAEQNDPVCSEIAERLTNAAVYMPALFDEARRPPDLTAQYICFAGPDVKLPTAEELTNPELSVKITRDKRAGQALLQLVADLCLHRAKTTRQPTLLPFDEFWRLMATPRGQQIVDEIVTEGRRYDVALGAIIQNAGLLSASVRSFAGQVMVFRCRNEAAKAAADLIGVTREQVEWLRNISKEDGTPASGFCYWRDVRGRLVLAQVLLPATDELAAAFDTTPPTVAV